MIQYYADSDVNGGKIIGFYNDDVHTPEQIPITAVEITEEQWQDALSNPRKYRVADGEMTARTQTEIDQEIADEEASRPPAPETEAQKIVRLEADKVIMQQQMAQMNSDFTSFQDFYFEQNPTQV